MKFPRINDTIFLGIACTIIYYVEMYEYINIINHFWFTLQRFYRIGYMPYRSAGNINLESFLLLQLRGIVAFFVEELKGKMR